MMHNLTSNHPFLLALDLTCGVSCSDPSYPDPTGTVCLACAIPHAATCNSTGAISWSVSTPSMNATPLSSLLFSTSDARLHSIAFLDTPHKRTETVLHSRRIETLTTQNNFAIHGRQPAPRRKETVLHGELPRFDHD